MRKTLILATATVLFLTACNSGSKNTKEETDTTTANNQSTPTDTLTNIPADDAAPADTGIASKVKAIRENFNRINAITKWGSVVTKELSETLEGGEATAYMNNNLLEKITTKQYGESFQVITEYYLYNNQLSFVYDKLLVYNRPMYYDSAAMKENNDTEAFDINKSAITETRSYFENQKMIHQISKRPKNDTETDSKNNTEKSILDAFSKLRKLYKK